MTITTPRTYRRSDVVAFRKTAEEFGGLSNMAPGYPIFIAGIHIRTSEALYQACRYPHLPKVQEMIFSEISPMTAKMRSKPYRSQSRSDWEDVRVPIMRWCLRVKLAQNWSKFSSLLLRTETRHIVENSKNDEYWGAIPEENGVFRGMNVLGRLLMELREKIRSEPDELSVVYPLRFQDFTLLGQEIPEITVDQHQFPSDQSAKDFASEHPRQLIRN